LKHHLAPKSKAPSTPIHPVEKRHLKKLLDGHAKIVKRWAEAMGYTAEPGSILLVPSHEGELARVLVGVSGHAGPWDFAGLSNPLPKGRYHIEGELSAAEHEAAALGWALSTYELARYRKARLDPSTLVLADGVDQRRVTRLADAIFLVRDLINTPASDMGPAELARAATDLAAKHGAKHRVIVGPKLLEKNFPAIYAVGKGSPRAPRLVDFTWGNPKHPKVTLVGKGVCFDSGGLDIKGSANMLLMKKDMGGAALVLGVAHVLMDMKLPIRLRVLVPAVENSVSGTAYRPLDVLRTRKGLTVEVGNTDAEGRIVLSDALAEADSDSPELIVDAATLTGAARVALGTKVPALFSNHDAAADELLAAGKDVSDPLWRLPLVDAYRSQLDSPTADMNNVSAQPYGGAITAALFLREFVSKKTPWIHIDTMGWNTENLPGRPTGGEAFALRAIVTMLERRYAKKKKG
jgi:leucyl aminopeptidase